ncbi:MAG: hypothetical protein ACFFCW_21305 [Candidatus Hodarchaeota archaeon]
MPRIVKGGKWIYGWVGVNYPALTVGASGEGCDPTIVGRLIRPGRFTRPLLPILMDSEATLRI